MKFTLEWRPHQTDFHNDRDRTRGRKARMKKDLPDPIVEFPTLVEILRWRAIHQPEQRTYTYLVDGETEGETLTYAGLDCQARSIAALLQTCRASGERALLLYPAGLEFIAAFFGCLYAGVIAVPLPPPNPAQPQRLLPRLRAIISDAQPSVVLTTAAILSNTKGLFTQAPEWQRLRWLASDRVVGSLAQEWRDPAVTGNSLALVQYTSGSTAEPKGVMISHGNLLHNSAYITRVFALIPDSVTVTWLPAFHDMGLTNGIIQPVYKGRPCFLMPPISFLMRPIRWLQAISRYKATISGGPNFAYELCTRRITPEQRETLDLRSWDVAYNGAEPVRADTMKRFAAAFASCGFRPSAFHPCYGLAEATLLVSGGSLRDEIFGRIQVAALEQNRVVEASEQHQNVRTVVSSGHAMLDTKIVIGRLKDLIIISGRKLYPHDIELTVERSHPALRPACCAAFSVDGSGEEHLIIAAEVEPRYQPAIPNAPDGEARAHPNGRLPLDAGAVVRAIRRAAAEEHDVRVHTVILLKAGRVPKTTSGKVQRHVCQAAFLKGTLGTLAEE